MPSDRSAWEWEYHVVSTIYSKMVAGSDSDRWTYCQRAKNRTHNLAHQSKREFLMKTLDGTRTSAWMAQPS